MAKKILINSELKEVVGVQIFVNGSWKAEVGGSSGTAEIWRKNLGTNGISGLAIPTVSNGSAAVGAFTSAGTCVMNLGTQGTISLTGHGLGTAREIYFCGTSGTTKVLPTGVKAFTHYYVSTMGYDANSFTFGTAADGTAGTQINLTGTAGTHCLWSKNA